MIRFLLYVGFILAALCSGYALSQESFFRGGLVLKGGNINDLEVIFFHLLCIEK